LAPQPNILEFLEVDEQKKDRKIKIGDLEGPKSQRTPAVGPIAIPLSGPAY
jgi:hypothetical protein